MATVLITPPVAEPVTLADMKLQCGLSPVEDTDHVKAQMVSQQLRRFIRGARAMCENYTRRVFLTQTWQVLLDGWPQREHQYYSMHYSELWLPKPPFQSLQFFVYVDTAGNFQHMVAPAGSPTLSSSGSGQDYTAPVYGCQTDPGSETQSARLSPPFALPFPPIRLVPNNVRIQFLCGYGAAGSSVPEPIVDAILLLGQYLRDGYPMEKDPPKIVKEMLDPYVNRVS
jgi:hypothetical protein